MITFLKKLFRTKLLNRIATQFIFSHVFLAVLSIALVGFFLLSESNSYIKQSVAKNQLEVARRHASDIYYFAKNTFSSLSFATKIQDVYLMQPFNQQIILDMMQTNNKDIFRKLFITDSTGLVVATTELGAKETYYPEIEKYNENTQVDPIISEVSIIDDHPVITVSSPIRQFDRYVGMLSVEVDVTFIW